MNNLSRKDIATEISLKYAQTLLTMSEIAELYNNDDDLSFKMNASTVSRMIYYCIFFRLIHSDVEKRIIQKIVDNRKKHCKYPERVGTSLFAKYNQTIHDREEYENLIETCSLIEKYICLKEELDNSSNLDLTDYISSEDERDYVGPRSIEEIDKDMRIIGRMLIEKNVDLTQVDVELKRLQRRINYFKSLYN